MKKTKVMQLRLTEAEFKKIEELSQDMCMNKTQYILYLINLNYKKLKGN